MSTHYPIGQPGKKWLDDEKQQWFEMQTKKRSYFDDVVTQIEQLSMAFDVEQYGGLQVVDTEYPLYIVKPANIDANKPNILVTGGVHGYETSGVHGALLFLNKHAEFYNLHFNIYVAPCVSPWGYETINRWNSKAIDPNRSFYNDSPAEESSALMAFIEREGLSFIAHFDLHETTDTDNSEFRPALAARDASRQDNWNIPDGFYLVGNTLNPQPEFQKAIIQSVAKITHIAPADEHGKLIGVELAQEGVINYAAKELGLCMGMTTADYVTTTEVYPDSPLVDNENCNLAQAAVIAGGLNFLLAR